MADMIEAMVEFAGNGSKVPGFMARPVGEGPFPGVVVIQEWWGLGTHIKDVVSRLARVGYAAVAPDLYRGRVAAEPDEARKLAMELDHPKALVDIQGAVNYLNAQAFVQPKKIGVIGFCMGGGLALMMASEGHDVGAVVVFYGGRGVWPEESVRKIHVPILGIFGEKDEGFPAEVLRQNETAARAMGKTIEIVRYPDAPHAFFNDERASYRPEAAADAWNRTLAWYRKYLT